MEQCLLSILYKVGSRRHHYYKRMPVTNLAIRNKWLPDRECGFRNDPSLAGERFIDPQS